MPEAVTSMQEIETGDFATWRWVLCPPSSIRVLNWNINRGLQLPRILDFLADAKPDVILLQESDLNARRTHHLNIARKISQKLQMNYVFGREFEELTQGSRGHPRFTCLSWPSHPLSLAVVEFPYHPIPKAVQFLATTLVSSRNRPVSGTARRAHSVGH